jgi:PAS domain S-box-containing protein
MIAGADGGRAHSFRQLRDSEELQRIVSSHTSDAVLLTDRQGRFTFVCPNIDAIFGYHADEVRAMPGIGCLLGEVFSGSAQLLKCLTTPAIECEVTVKGGGQRALRVHVKEVPIDGGRILYACRDVTDRKAAEELLRVAREDLAHASRLALLGELTVSIVHEVTQPLAATSANASAGLRVLENELGAQQAAALREILDDILNESERAAAIVHRVRQLARKRSPEREALDVNDVMRDLVGLMTSEARRRAVTLRTDFAPFLPKVYGDRVSLQLGLLAPVMLVRDRD